MKKRQDENLELKYAELEKQLAAKNRELEIEVSLERVRSAAMAMAKPDELLNICKLAYQELQTLGFSSMRNSQIFIFDDAIGAFTNYGFSDDEGANIAVIYYDSHPKVKAFINNVRKKSDAFAELSIKGDELAAWRQFRIDNGEPDDYRLGNIDALYYYFYSIGIGAIGISTFEALSEGQRQILKRFRNVFDLAYRRYADIQLAEAQAKEAQIQLALERVRGRTMAMQHSDELSETAHILFQQFTSLGEKPLQITIGIINAEDKTIEFWATDLSGNKTEKTAKGSLDEPFLLSKLYAGWKKKKKSAMFALSGEELNGWIRYRQQISGLTSPTDETQGTRYAYVGYFSKGAISISTDEPLPDQTVEILERFARVFDGTYTRFLDLQNAEAQAREAQIEASLERIRSKTMGMRESNELGQVIQLIYEQFKLLQFNIDTANFAINLDESDDLNLWIATTGYSYPTSVYLPYIDHPIFNAVKEVKKNKLRFLAYELSLAEKNEFFEYFFKVVGNVSSERQQVISSVPGYATSSAFMQTVALSIINYSGVPYSREENEALLRFGTVFEQAYVRFLDLQQAEAQAREAQIQLALERVRARTMAMQHSKELPETSALLFQQVKELGEAAIQNSIAVVNEEAGVVELSTTVHGSHLLHTLRVPMNEPFLMAKAVAAWKANEKSLILEFTGKQLKEYNALRNSFLETKVNFPEDLWLVQISFFSKGWLSFSFNKKISEELVAAQRRFAAVFDQTYTRFLDLQKAEAQAGEAQVEAALERVRSKTMAMHTSDDVADTVISMFNELVILGIEKTARSGISIIYDNQEMELWRASYDTDGKAGMIIGRVDMTIHPSLLEVYRAFKNNDECHSYELTGKDQYAYFKALNDSPNYPVNFDLASLPEKQINTVFFFPEGCLFVNTLIPLSEEVINLFKRFAGVFGQTYRRYLDLQQAEAAARESKIEAALERVRGKAMAMYNSKDLSSTASLVFTELRKLGILPVRCGVGMASKGSRKVLLYSAISSTDGDSLALIGWVQLQGHPVLENIYQSIVRNENYFPVLKGEQLKSYYEKLLSGLSLPSVPNWETGDEQFGHFLPFPDGCLYAWSVKPYADTEIKILTRFASVIDLTFRRYTELQKSEASAREAIKQASLDRVRAEIASMRKRTDLERITPLIWDELTILGIPFIRCGIFIMDDEEKLIHTFLSTPDGKAIGAFHIPFDTAGNFEKMVASWRNKEPYIDHWRQEAFSQFADALVKQGAITSGEYMRTIPPEGVHLNFLPFLQGMLYVGNTEPLAEDNISLIQAVADAFSTAYARYEDFNKLEAAKQQVDKTLSDLKATQTRLIQTEKMASLGELTAGIAHEIQNPLNFVNNFSEVNQEMIDELNDELKAGNIEEAMAIAADIKDNEQKINHHGKRAEGIVKGMLQHSRAGGAEKQPTNINALADEFLRLSYHGLRAKDKVFNSELVTQFDPDLPKISVVPQDIGRVLLNLFNNAFYAVNEKQKTTSDDYKPEVAVGTTTENGQLIIRVKDNGTGMPEPIKEKIMQPFFTTKPTGEGTGLGLSLSYDMVVKGHGGTIDVNTEMGKGSEFIIMLPLE